MVASCKVFEVFSKKKISYKQDDQQKIAEMSRFFITQAPARVMTLNFVLLRKPMCNFSDKDTTLTYY